MLAVAPGLYVCYNSSSDMNEGATTIYSWDGPIESKPHLKAAILEAHEHPYVHPSQGNNAGEAKSCLSSVQPNVK